MIRAGLALVGAAFALALFTVVMALQNRAWGQDGHAENHDWYKELRSNAGHSCCNALTADGKGDCRPVSARPRDNGNGWEAWYNGQWNRIPDSAILPDEFNLVPLYAHICEQGGWIHCFLKGGGGS